MWIGPLFQLIGVALSAEVPCPELRPGRPKKAAEHSSTFSTRIIGGTDAPRGRYPYSVSLETAQGNHVCGGTLVDPTTVLTAAHCGPSFSYITIGRYNRTDDSEEFERFAVDQKVPHPLYDDEEFPYDFLLVKMRGVSKYAPVRINRNEDIPINGMELVVMGFGVTVAGAQVASDLMQVATVNYIPNAACDESEDPDFVYDSYRGKISSDMLCASDFGQDSCQGDSGGPLILEGNDAEGDLQVGLVSWGYGCALENFPGVYARISHEIKWIEETVCALTENESTMFDCGIRVEETPPPTPNNQAVGDPVAVTVVMQLDTNPEETGWRIQDALGNVFREVTPGTYTQESELVTETVFLQRDSVHEFVVVDSEGNGFCCGSGSGYYQLIAGYPGAGDVLVFGNGYFEFEKKAEFTSPAVSADPPPTEETPEPSQAPNEPEEEAPLIPITMLIKFDRYPEEVGWRLERHSTTVEVIAGVSPGMYSVPHATVVETALVHPAGLYKFIIFDVFQDGMCCQFGDGMYQVFLGTDDTTNEEAIILSQDGDFGPGREHPFVAQGNGLLDPDPPFDDFLTLEIKFDSFPGEVGWILEMERDEGATAAQREIHDSSELVAVGYSLPGTYGAELALRVSREIIAVPSDSSSSFVFTMVDSSEDGLCCEFGSGYFALYYGPVQDGEVLATSSFEKTGRESHGFRIDGNNSSAGHTRISSWPLVGAAIVSLFML